MKKQLTLMMLAVIFVCGACVFTSCSKDDGEGPVKKEYFQLWNKCEALTALQAYVEDVTNPQSPNYISEEDRIATFDMDGTFLAELYPSYFEYNLLEYVTEQSGQVVSSSTKPRSHLLPFRLK